VAETMTRPPVELAVGETVSWRMEFSDYKATDGWVVAAHFRGATNVDVVGVQDGEGFTFSIESSVFTAAAVGGFVWEAVATLGGERVRVASGRLQVVADLEAASDLRSQSTHAERMLSALEAALEGTASKSQLSYTIAGRSISRIPIETLEALHARYRRRVDRERMLVARGIDRAPQKVRAILP